MDLRKGEFLVSSPEFNNEKDFEHAKQLLENQESYTYDIIPDNIDVQEQLIFILKEEDEEKCFLMKNEILKGDGKVGKSSTVTSTSLGEVEIKARRFVSGNKGPDILVATVIAA